MADISKIVTPDGLQYDIRAGGIPYGEVDSTSTSTAFTATVPGITELTDGTCVLLKNGVVTSASGFTININGLGAKNVYNNMAAATAETTIFNVAYTMLFVYDSTRDADGGWICYRGYNSDTTTGREEYYYLRPYAGQAIYRYKYLMEGEDGRFYPITTTNQSSATQVTKTPTTVGLRPWKIWYYTGTATVSAGAAFGAQTVQPSYYNTTAVYNFNASTGTYAYIFLQGSYNKDTDLFTLDTGSNYYKFVRYNTAINWASAGLTSGKYYILLGSTYSTTNYVQLFNVNPFYYFDGTRLIPVERKVTKDLIAESIPTKTSDLTNDSGFLTTETDPTVPAWAKASTKPTYTASEVGAIERAFLPIEIEDNCPKTIYNIYVNGSVAMLLDMTGTNIRFPHFATKATYGLEAIYAQVINGATDFTQANARAFVIAGLDMSTASVKLVSVYSGVVYTVNLQDTGSGLIGTFTSQTLPTSADITAWNGAVTTANTALSGVNGNLIYDHTFTISNGVATFVPHVYQKGAEVTSSYAASCFTWKYRLIDGSEVTLPTNSTTKGCAVTISTMGYGGHVIGAFTPA